ncbi:MAG: hypothetical protein JSR26_04020 [Proteobacteria bacterium]|nr:hypothetical protein [Pseudomonadota bacterium]
MSSDKAVAELLGMGEKALNARKRRDSFPAEKVKVLAADRPDLNLDVRYVLTGITEALDNNLNALREATRLAVALGLSRREGGFVRDVVYGALITNSSIVKDGIEKYLIERSAAQTQQAPTKRPARGRPPARGKSKKKSG